MKIYNDGKGRDQSWEARVCIDEVNHDGSYSLKVEAFGFTEKETRKNLHEQITLMIEHLNRELITDVYE